MIKMTDSTQCSNDSLKSYFQQICQTWVIPEDICMLWWNVIKEKYSELKRRYHTLNHLKDMFDHYNAWIYKLHNPTSVACAIFFHDIIYDPTLDTNEKKSMEHFKEFAYQGSLLENLQKEVIDKIEATITHVPNAREGGMDSDVMFFLDFDMAVLGKDETDYNSYASQIRQEYSHLSDDIYKERRAQVLEGFLFRDHIFATKEFQTKYEAQARTNISTEFTLLTS